MCTNIASKAGGRRIPKRQKFRITPETGAFSQSLLSRGLLPATPGEWRALHAQLGGPNGDSEAHALPPKLLAEIDTGERPPKMQKSAETLYSQTCAATPGNFHEITRSLDATSGFNELEKLDRRAFSNDVDRLRGA